MDLKDRPYVYCSELNEDGKSLNKGRFTLILKNSEKAEDNDIVNGGDSIIETNSIEITQMDHVINVDSDEELNELSTISVINILRQTEVFSTYTLLLAGSNIITLPDYLEGFHKVTVRTGNQIITKKVVL